MHAPGTAVAIRSIREFTGHGRAVGFAVSGTVVTDDDELVAVVTTTGSEFRVRAGQGGGPNARIVLPGDWSGEYEPRTWQGDAVVRVHRWGDRWSVWRWHDGESWTDRWYGNLESPWRRSETGYDTQDWALDIVACGQPGTANWSVEYKDEDELSWMIERGYVTPAEAAVVRAAGGELFSVATDRAWPFDAEWDVWLPHSNEPTVMPAGWETV